MLIIPSNTIFKKFGDNFVCCGCVKDCSCYNTPERREGGRKEGGQASLFVCLFVLFLSCNENPLSGNSPLARDISAKLTFFPKIGHLCRDKFVIVSGGQAVCYNAITLFRILISITEVLFFPIIIFLSAPQASKKASKQASQPLCSSV
jgi:hypothetical protein